MTDQYIHVHTLFAHQCSHQWDWARLLWLVLWCFQYFFSSAHHNQIAENNYKHHHGCVVTLWQIGWCNWFCRWIWNKLSENSCFFLNSWQLWFLTQVRVCTQGFARRGPPTVTTHLLTPIKPCVVESFPVIGLCYTFPLWPRTCIFSHFTAVSWCHVFKRHHFLLHKQTWKQRLVCMKHKSLFLYVTVSSHSNFTIPGEPVLNWEKIISLSIGL